MVKNPYDPHHPFHGDNIQDVFCLDKLCKEHRGNWLYQENSSTLFDWLLQIPMPASILTSHRLTNGLHFFGSFCVYLAPCSKDLRLQNISFLQCLLRFLEFHVCMFVYQKYVQKEYVQQEYVYQEYRYIPRVQIHTYQDYRYVHTKSIDTYIPRVSD